MNYDRQTVDDRFSVPRGYQRERNLRIDNVRTSDAGLYACKLSAQDTTRASVRLVVNGTVLSMIQTSGGGRFHDGAAGHNPPQIVARPRPHLAGPRIV